jgi:hypothetical protein
MAALKNNAFAVFFFFFFFFILGKTASVKHDVLKIAFCDNSMGTTQTVEWFCQFKSWKILLEGLSVQFVPPQVAHKKTWRSLAKSTTNADEAAFRRSMQVQILIINMPI